MSLHVHDRPDYRLAARLRAAGVTSSELAELGEAYMTMREVLKRFLQGVAAGEDFHLTEHELDVIECTLDWLEVDVPDLRAVVVRMRDAIATGRAECETITAASAERGPLAAEKARLAVSARGKSIFRLVYADDVAPRGRLIDRRRPRDRAPRARRRASATSRCRSPGRLDEDPLPRRTAAPERGER